MPDNQRYFFEILLKIKTIVQGRKATLTYSVLTYKKFWLGFVQILVSLLQALLSKQLCGQNILVL